MDINKYFDMIELLLQKNSEIYSFYLYQHFKNL